jgi:serine/threonine-protein kinase
VVGIGDVIADKFKIERMLGRGGMGYVMAARHEQLGHEVAIKVLVPGLCQREEAVARFLREARAAASLLSEHVARVLDVGTLEDGVPYMVMEFLEGRDLAREIEERVLPVRETVDYVLQACEALAEAHTRGIVHRDLKPANLFLGRRPDGSILVKVLDFGISNMVPTGPNARDESRWTDTKSLVGSPQYMSPEQVRDPKTVDPRSDIWSIGVILFELLTGSTPFASDNTLSVLAGVVADDPPPVRIFRPDVSLALEHVILKCLDKRPSARYATVVALAEALAAFTPTGEAAIARISAVARSAADRVPADRQPPGWDADTKRAPPIVVATVESPRLRDMVANGDANTSGRRRRPTLPAALRRAAAVAVGAAGIGGALFCRDFFAHRRQDKAAPVSCEASGSALATVTARAVANDDLEAEAPSIATSHPPSLPAMAATSASAPRSILVRGKDAPTKVPAFESPFFETPADPLEGRQ